MVREEPHSRDKRIISGDMIILNDVMLLMGAYFYNCKTSLMSKVGNVGVKKKDRYSQKERERASVCVCVCVCV